MPDAEAMLLNGQRGVYEQVLSADVPLHVTIQDGNYQNLQVVHHDGDHPIYLAVNRAIAARDPSASIVLPGTWLAVNLGESASYVLTIVSSGTATVSVVRL